MFCCIMQAGAIGARFCVCRFLCLKEVVWMVAPLRFICIALLLGISSVARAGEPVTASRLGDSVFRDVWHAILDEAGIKATLVAAPRDVRRDMFVRGELVLDCCSAEAWRNRPEEIETQLWSQPFFYTVDHLILRAGREYEIPDRVI